MDPKKNALSEIVTAIRALPSSSKKTLEKEDSFNYTDDLQHIIGLILHNKALGEIEWNKVSKDLATPNWYNTNQLNEKSIEDLRALIYFHTRNERFSHGHIQNLAASGYFDAWAKALEEKL